MKKFQILFMAALVSMVSFNAFAQTSAKSSQSDKVEVYYFHFTKRCATCNAVESVSKEMISETYGNKVSFADYNLDEEDGEAIGNKMDVAGQTLLIVKGDKKIDITSEGFMYARANPEKLKSIIKEKIDSLL